MPDNTDDNVFDLFGDDKEPEDDSWLDLGPENTEEADPGTVAFMDQQAAEFNAKAEHEFADRYGFVHKCRCDQDYVEGKMVEVTECYANMTLEALDACAALYAENKLLTAILSKAVTSGLNVTHIGGANVPEQQQQLDVEPEATDDEHPDPADGFA